MSNNIFEYNSILTENEAEITEKKSRFIGYVCHIESENEAKQILMQRRKKHYEARHHCYAYRLLENGRITERFSDDGEPSQTAGLPILSVIKGGELINVMILVTRYFGGTLLGTGGLVKSYTQASKEVINISEILTIKKYLVYIIKADYNIHSKIAYELVDKNYFIYKTDYGGTVDITVFSEQDRTEKLEILINDITSKTAEMIKSESIMGYEKNNVIVII